MTALLGTIALAVVAVVAVGYPLVRGVQRRATLIAAGEGRRAALEARREALYAALKDLEFDHEMGKLSAGDYAALRERYTVQAVAVLQQLDALAAEEPPAVGEGEPAPDGEPATAGPEAEVLTTEDEEIEREVAALRRAMKGKGADRPFAAAACPACGRAYRPGDAFCAGCGASLAEDNHRCPECGAEYVDDDRFCARCGATLSGTPQPGA